MDSSRQLIQWCQSMIGPRKNQFKNARTWSLATEPKLHERAVSQIIATGRADVVTLARLARVAMDIGGVASYVDGDGNKIKEPVTVMGVLVAAGHVDPSDLPPAQIALADEPFLRLLQLLSERDRSIVLSLMQSMLESTDSHTESTSEDLQISGQ